ncbi:MAG: 2-succinyl-5-enolpyruvyl-6-hydroxy-3-cyclohexene-1-carboxylic-acid synthase [Bdellovibrionaceae bacterium]|nr:2-succinyl-5-enolpyruvyl-6-hydroxy-3-cyclohexene-1-carboxylic-acid synthase [Pseudobdellovibrionaceae bacterium]MBX3033009.1 2-succinyl-5-enolpyruvyl-6-hydroxy-3-cyclohexene-1-carboxylic-acid synthase [Pseudobdellovibrionaceae bacterium]
MTNMQLAHRVLQNMLAAGVREFCLCAGARNSPFVYLIQENPHLKTYHFFEERSASFFALGRIAATRHPVAVITTSGTAVAECLPATIEGSYSSLPLIVVTADRPKRYRGTGAPQSIEQVGLFSYYIEACFDLDAANTHVSFNGLSWKKPVHVNVCFAEPLLDGPATLIEPPEQEMRTRFPESIPMQMVDEMDEFLSKHRPLVVMSTVPDKVREQVANFLSRLQAPIYAEGISCLRGHPSLEKLQIRSGERMVGRLLDEGICDAVLRIGGVPTLRLWRDLEDKRADLPVFSLGYNHFTGLSRAVPHYDNLDDLSRIQIRGSRPLPDEVLRFDREKAAVLEKLCEKYPSSEVSLIRQLSLLTRDQSVYLGNSLPIREWDLGAVFEQPPRRVAGNRGANGIDGQLSTFLGWSRHDTENWCLVGDLTAMYDLSSLWVTPQLAAPKIRVVVINNSGGMIFKRLFGQEIFLNRHHVKFDSWASMWGWAYTRWSRVPDRVELEDRHLIELEVSEEQTEKFWKEWDALWM